LNIVMTIVCFSPKFRNYS